MLGVYYVIFLILRFCFITWPLFARLILKTFLIFPLFRSFVWGLIHRLFLLI
ncbi:MAG: hypothetical protein MRERV_74c003 [Mycoplasmataceae bacterium RV_VA103A]|nr:MAG: hypothetical protein MRERV_74c003 [Mycoplasmataceae bacterium RV_VA103A]